MEPKSGVLRILSADLRGYLQLIDSLAHEMTFSELASLDLSARPPSAAQSILAVDAIERRGKWRGVIVVIHKFGIVGHYVHASERETYEEAQADGQTIAERFMDRHELLTGVRHRGILTDDGKVEE